MSSVRVEKQEFGLREKLTELDYGKLPYHKMPVGTILQVRQSQSSSNMTISSNSYTNLRELTIAPEGKKLYQGGGWSTDPLHQRCRIQQTNPDWPDEHDPNTIKDFVGFRLIREENKQTEEVKNDVKTSDSAEPNKEASTEENSSNKETNTMDKNTAAVSNLRLLENIEVKLTVEVGNTEIKINELAEERSLSFEEATEVFLARRGQTRNFINPAQVAKLIIFLCQDSSHDITGAALPIDQGRSSTWLEFGDT